MLSFSKQPAETYKIAIEFAGKLPAGSALASGTVAAFDPSGVDVTNTILQSGTVSIVGTQARVRALAAGTHGYVYRIRFLVTLDNSDILEEDVTMTVENL